MRSQTDDVAKAPLTFIRLRKRPRLLQARLSGRSQLLHVAREESQRLSVADFPEADFWTVLTRTGRVARCPPTIGEPR